MHRCPTCSREIRTLEAPVRREGPLTPEAYAMNALNRDRLDDLRHNTVHPAPVASALCIDCWAKTPEGIAWEKDKFGTPKTATTPVAEPPAAATPDYTKVGGWLMFFGILAGLAFPLGVISMVSGYAKQVETFRQLPAWAAFIYAGSAMIGCLVLLVALAQCVCIFQRRHLGRTLSLAYYGTSLGLLIIKLPALGEFIEVAAKGAGVANSAAFSGGVVFSWFLGVAMNCVCLAYFLKSERVKMTLIN